MTLNVGLVGAGTHGARYLRHLRNDVHGLDPVALARRDEAAGTALAAELDVRWFADADQLIDDPAVHAVVIATPPSTHAHYAARALEAGKPVLLEKPMTGTLAEARTLAELAARPGAPPLMVAQTLRWNPVLQRVRELWPRLGPVHLVRLARWLTGREVVRLDSQQRNVQNPVVEDLFLARAELDDGCWASFEVSKYTRSRCCLLEAVGEHGQLLADYLEGGISLRCGRDVVQEDVDARVPTLPAVLTAWRDAIAGTSAVPVTATDGLRTMEIVEACYISASEARSVAIGTL